MAATLYHNPRCSKSRAALALLSERSETFTTVRYLEAPLELSELLAVLDRLTTGPESLVRSGDDGFADLGIDAVRLTDADFVAALLAEHPRFMQRPLLVTDEAAVLGRPPEAVLELF